MKIIAVPFFKIIEKFHQNPQTAANRGGKTYCWRKTFAEHERWTLAKNIQPNLGCRAFCLPKSIGPSIADRGGAYVKNQAIHGPSVAKHKHGQQVAAENRATKRLRALVMREIGAVMALSCYSKFSDPDN
ncbi:hypothetical protein [Burkholderia sp. AU28863]|uniref:hypothetical protein n=1 Tax=Burkholderia sp. AU28863 TaxID=2015352 RepID=UPI00117826B4|nr:hypothetical protein [Burkholderia sp. AU28863]